MNFEVWCKTDRGLRRDTNQDSYLINRELGLFIVADGMGGHTGGEVASSMAVTTVEEVMIAPEFRNDHAREAIVKAYSEASHRIFDKASSEYSDLSGMGTTMVMAHIRGKSLFIGNVGDSRCYLHRRPSLWQVTEDHSLINEQIRAGLLAEDQAHLYVGRNVITRSVGYEREVFADVIERDIVPGESYLLCSDGLTGMVPDQKIAEILNSYPPDRAAKLCLDQALANGGDDNVTVLVLHFF